MDLSSLVKIIKNGRRGFNKGIPTGFNRLDKYIHGIQKRYFYLLGGDSGSGKTAFAIYTFVFQPLIHSNADILYFSLELSEEVLYTKLMSLYIYEKYKRIITFDQIMSLEEPLSDSDYEYVKLAYAWIKSLKNRLTIFSDSTSSKRLYVVTREWLAERGTFNRVSDYVETYTQHNDNYNIVVCDHIGLLHNSEGNTLKQEIDLACKMLITFRNKCGITVVAVQQLNRSFKNIERKKLGFELINLADFSDSSGPTQAAELVIAIFDAYREKVKNCAGYHFDKLLDNGRILQILKHRFGQSNLNIGLNFFGNIGVWGELPKPEDIYDYNKYTQIDGITAEEGPSKSTGPQEFNIVWST
jgi:replicative DNA helicase